MVSFNLFPNALFSGVSNCSCSKRISGFDMAPPSAAGLPAGAGLYLML